MSVFSKKIDQLMAREMTRKQFLMTLGMLAVSVFGFSSLFGIFSDDEPNRHGLPPYGMQNYGP